MYMNIEWYIEKWHKAWIIDDELKKSLLKDAKIQEEHEKKNRVAWMFGIVWASVLWLWILLFIWANWHVIPGIVKILGSLSLSWLCAYLSYRYDSMDDRQKTSWALSLLTSIFWWATTILVAQNYSTWDTSKIHYVILIWMVWTLPAIYAFNSVATAALFSGLVVAWMIFFMMWMNFDWNIIAIAAAWISLFWIWWIHRFWPKYIAIGRAYRIIWLYVAMFAFFCLSVFKYYDLMYSAVRWMDRYVYAILVSLVFVLISAYAAKKDKEALLIEHIPPMIWIGIIFLLMNISPSESTQHTYNYYEIEREAFFPIMIIINLFLVSLCTLVLWIWYRSRDSKLVNAGYFFWTLFLIVKYCQVWWWMMSASFFFIAWWIIFLTIWYFVEKNRRNIVAKINAW